MATTQQLERLREFIEPARIAVVATIGSDGMPHLTPNWYAYDGKTIVISTTRPRVKYRNLQRDPRMAVSIYSEPMAAEYVTVSGPTEIIEGDRIWKPTREIVQRYLPPDKADAMLDSMRSQERVILALTPEKVFFRYP